MAAGLIRDINLGNSFDIGVAEADKIHVKVDGSTIVRAADGVLSAPAATPPALVVAGYANVNADGTTAAASPGVTVTQTAIGRYDVVPPPGTVSAIVSIFEPETTRDALSGHFTDFTFTRLWVGESDNGGSAAIGRSKPLSLTFMSVP